MLEVTWDGENDATLCKSGESQVTILLCVTQGHTSYVSVTNENKNVKTVIDLVKWCKRMVKS